jgi:hypothetical protein
VIHAVACQGRAPLAPGRLHPSEARDLPDEPRHPHLHLVRERAPRYGEPVGATDAAAVTALTHSDPHPAPDPFDDADALDELADEIATLAAHIHAATQRLLLLIADFDRRRGWELGGHRSCAHWLSYRTGIDLGAAREKVRVARRLVGLPETSAAMARGELSFSKVRALTRVAWPDNERELVELARGTTAAQLERMIRGWKRGSRKDEAELERERHESRTFSVFPDEDGMYLVRGRLDPEVAAVLMRAVEAASDALFRENPNPLETQDDEERRRAAAQRRADAVGLLAERALAVGFGRSNSGDAEGDCVAEGGCVTEGDCVAEGGCVTEGDSVAEGDESADVADAPISGTRAARYQVVLHVDAATLSAEGEGEKSELDDGMRVSAETSRRLACDAALVRVRRAPDGRILGVGRRTRTISPALRRALEVRDRGCRFPGCGLRFTDAHHVRHWADGGETSLSNCALLCRHHHRLLHEGGWRMEWWGEGRPAFIDPRGNRHFEGGWKPPESDGQRDAERGAEASDGVDPGGASATGELDWVAELVRANRLAGARPDGWAASARWKTAGQIPDEVLLAAWEAIT